MSVRAVQSQSDKDRLLRNLPDGTLRVQVVDDHGKIKYKRPDDVGHVDQIMLNAKGEPIVMKGAPGRKAKIDLKPINDSVGEVMEARGEHLATSELLTSARKDPEGDAILDHTIRAMAEEAAALEFERGEAERHGNDTSGISVKRTRVLKAMADTWLKRREKLQSGIVDLESQSMKILMGFILETFRASLQDAGTRPEHTETIFAKLSKRLEEGWNEEAKARMKERA